MLHQLLDHLEWNRGNIGAGECGIDDMHRMTDGRREDLGFVAVIAVDLDDVVYDLHSILSNIVQTANKG